MATLTEVKFAQTGENNASLTAEDPGQAAVYREIIEFVSGLPEALGGKHHPDGKIDLTNVQNELLSTKPFTVSQPPFPGAYWTVTVELGKDISYTFFV